MKGGENSHLPLNGDAAVRVSPCQGHNHFSQENHLINCQTYGARRSAALRESTLFFAASGVVKYSLRQLRSGAQLHASGLAFGLLLTGKSVGL